MSCGVVAFTQRGAALGRVLARALGGTLHLPPRLAELCGGDAYTTLEDWVAESWHTRQSLVFVGACGIAVRAAAPHLRDKFSDPAVVVVDEAGDYAIALVSGHLGGANALARTVAGITGGQAVITTATDVNHRFAVDVWAGEQQLTLGDRQLAKAVSAALLEGRPVGFCSDFALQGVPPPGLTPGGEGLHLYITDRAEAGPLALRLIPRSLILGIGCRRGWSAQQIGRAAERALARAGLDRRAVACAATIDRKKEEPGLRAFCAGWQISLTAWTPEQLRQVPGCFSASERVRRVTGVDNVCERAAVGAGGRLVLPKQAEDGVTVAIARKDLVIHWGKETT